MSLNNIVKCEDFRFLITQRRWACYKAIWDNSRGKNAKKPISPITGFGAKSNDPKTWGTFAQAVAYMRRHKNMAGIVIALSSKDDLVGIDIDDCIDDNGVLSELAIQIIEIADSYTEISPSGKGIRIFLRGHLPVQGRKNSSNGVEMYDAARFLTITGNHLPSSPLHINNRQEQVNKIHQNFILTRKNALDFELTSSRDKHQRSLEISDEELIEKALYSANGEAFEDLLNGDWDSYPSQSEADAAFCCMLAFWTGWNAQQMDRIFRDSDLYREKWDSIRYGDGRTYGEGLIEWAIVNTDSCYLQEVDADE